MDLDQNDPKCLNTLFEKPAFLPTRFRYIYIYLYDFLFILFYLLLFLSLSHLFFLFPSFDIPLTTPRCTLVEFFFLNRSSFSLPTHLDDKRNDLSKVLSSIVISPFIIPIYEEKEIGSKKLIKNNQLFYSHHLEINRSNSKENNVWFPFEKK